MGVKLKNEKEVEILREGGKRLSTVLRRVASEVRVGMTKIEINKMAERYVLEVDSIPAFKNYKPAGSRVAFPAVLCISVNDEIVHGIPSGYKLKEGDIVGLDLGIKYGGLFTDMAVTVGMGKIDEPARRLMAVTERALEVGIMATVAGNYTGDIGHAIESFVKPYGYGIVRELSGHGVGHKIHEDPYVPNFGKPGAGIKLRPGMVLALEPMINEGSGNIVLGSDEFTFRTRDKSRSAHFEKTILITDGAAEILTP